MKKYDIDIKGTTASTKKTMGTEPRMISKIDITATNKQSEILKV